ncbi:hypothetical protein VTL71DRAFT_6499 [Oculimacula yallundae]|uniref:Spermatogenesis-associated protein 20-like TRX domain-containing protein n=1 Tax=Oculimacula yallundae TaxID=86028 RepID=A0ABR4BX50_9HELO
MAAQLRGSGSGSGAEPSADGTPTANLNQGIGTALKNGLTGEASSSSQYPSSNAIAMDRGQAELVLTNRAGESRSPYVRAHKDNPVKWQLWGDEAIEMAKRENRLLFLSVGYAACHWCHVMERESFENEEVASILNSAFIPIKIDREERPDIDRIYMNFVQATTGSGGWPLNVFVTPDLEPVFGGTYWPGPTSQTPFEDQVDFLGILDKLSTVWREQEQRCRSDSKQILEQLKSFAAEGTFGDRLGEGADGLDIELIEEANQHFASTFDSQNGGFGSAPKFPTPSKLSFLLRLGQYPPVVIDVVGAADCGKAQNMAVTTLKKMARGGIHDHIGNGFARYSVTADWSLPHFEKMLYDNAQLLHVYLDAFLLSRDAELLGVVYDISTYLTTDLADPEGGFYSSEDADSLYRKGDTEKREGAFYVWTKREFENVLGSQTEPILSAFFNVSGHGNVLPENDAHDEFLDQNVLAIVNTPSSLASQFGMKEEEVVRIIKEGKVALRSHREKERVRPVLDDKIVVSWNGIAIGALARTGAVIKGFDPIKSKEYLDFAIKAATFIKEKLYDADKKILYRIWREGRGDTEGFADDYAFLIEGLLDLYEATFEEKWLQWADELQQTQNTLFYDTTTTSGFFSTSASAPHIILRLKDGMDTSEPSTNGTSASNLYRLSSLLNDESYGQMAKTTIAGFESEVLQYPWLFASFMPCVVAGQLGVRGVVVAGGVDSEKEEGENMARVKEFEKSPRGGLSTFAWLKEEGGWLRSRNPLLKDFKGGDGKARVMVCEGGVCVEEGVLGEERVVSGSSKTEGEDGNKVGEKEGEPDVHGIEKALRALTAQGEQQTQGTSILPAGSEQKTQGDSEAATAAQPPAKTSS